MKTKLDVNSRKLYTTGINKSKYVLAIFSSKCAFVLLFDRPLLVIVEIANCGSVAC